MGPRTVPGIRYLASSAAAPCVGPPPTQVIGGGALRGTPHGARPMMCRPRLLGCGALRATPVSPAPRARASHHAIHVSYTHVSLWAKLPCVPSGSHFPSAAAHNRPCNRAPLTAASGRCGGKYRDGYGYQNSGAWGMGHHDGHCHADWHGYQISTVMMHVVMRWVRERNERG